MLRKRDVLSNHIESMFERLIDDFFKSTSIDVPRIFIHDSKYKYPKMDVVEYNDRYVVECAVPGLSSEELEVTYRDGVLYIYGKKKNVRENEAGSVLVKELHRSGFSRALSMQDVQPEKIKCKLQNGILTITLPKVNEAKTIPIKINAEETE